MTGPDNSRSSDAGDADAGYGADSAGSVTTVSHSSSFPQASPFSDDSPNSPYGAPRSGSPAATSAWTGSPYEPLPSESSDYSQSPSGFGDATPTYVGPPVDNERVVAPVSGKQTKSRAVAGLLGGVLGTLLIAGGLYLVGEFGFRIFDIMLNVGGQPSPWDIAWTSVGAAMIFAAVLLNGWTPWATLPAGLVLTAAGVWSIAWYDGADRVATLIDRAFARPEMVVWGINGWLLVLGLVFIGASGAAIIARAAGRRRGRP